VVLLGQRRHWDATLDGDRLVLTDLAAGQDSRRYTVPLNVYHLKQDATVYLEEVAFRELVNDVDWMQVERASVSGNQGALDPHDAAVPQLDNTVDEPVRSDLGPFRVEAEGYGRLALDILDDLGEVLDFRVRQVQAKQARA
jgi:hypothetical protein